MSSPPPTPKHPHLPLALLATVLLTLLVYRGYGLRFATRPTDHYPAAAAVDLNAADKSELLQVPGIGPSLADAILTHRRSVGRFEQVDDLAAVRGIGPKTIDRLRPWVRVGEGEAGVVARGQEPQVERLERKPSAERPMTTAGGKKLEPGETINVNTASAEELQRLPGIGGTLAGRVVAEREKRPFASVEDLERVSGIGSKTVEKLRPFVLVK
jgi:competence protein ComEA